MRRLEPLRVSFYWVLSCPHIDGLAPNSFLCRFSPRAALPPPLALLPILGTVAATQHCTNSSSRSPLPPSLLPFLFPISYQIATGSSENVVKIWDVRRRQNIYTLPAHSALVAAVKYVPGG